MKAFEHYKEQKALLEASLVAQKKAAADEVLAEIRECIREFNFTPQDIFSSDVLHPKRRRVRVRYFDPISGATWSGVGREPLWIRGKDRRQFELPPSID